MKILSLKQIYPCFFAIFIDIIGYSTVSPLLISFFTDPAYNIFGIDSSFLRYFYLGLALIIHPLCVFLGTAFIGDLSDSVGRKKTLVFSMLGMIVGFGLMGVAVGRASLLLFFVGRALSGAVSASQAIALATISDLSDSTNKAIHLSYVSLVECLGFVVGPLFGGILLEFNLYMPFFWTALGAMAALFWIAISFKETLQNRKERALRFFKLFGDAYRNREVAQLSLIFFMMQVGVSLYLPIILIHLRNSFHYDPWVLGLFNGYMGIAFGVGLLFVFPRMLKRYPIEKVVVISLAITFIAQLLSACFRAEVSLWVVAFPLAIACEIAFSGMFTCFSNAANEDAQGWVMGLSVAIMSIAWAVTAFFTLFIPSFGTQSLIFIGSLCLGVSAYLMRSYLQTKGY